MPAYKWTVFSNTTIGSFMAAVDTSIVLISLPTILKELPGTGPGEGLWIIMSYLLVTSTLILNFGRLGDMFGRVKMYNLGFAVFTVGSFLCSLSQIGLELVIFRLMQGLGSALLWANSGAIITDAFPINERGRALGMNQAVMVSGSVVGLVLGGILTVTLGWRSIFWVNVPIGIFATLWAHWKLKEIVHVEKNQKLDVWGNFSFAFGLSMILLGVTLGALQKWTATNYMMIGVGVVLLLSFLYIETKVAQPMFELSLFRLKIFAGGNITAFGASLARGAFTFVMSFYLQGVLGYSALTAGILLIPLSGAVAFVGPLSGILSDKYGSLKFAIAGLLISGVAFLILHQISAHIIYAVLVIPLMLLGAGWGLNGSPVRSETLSAVPPAYRGVGSGINMTIMNVGMLLSLALSILIISSSVPHSVIVGVFGGGVGAAGGGPSIRDVTDFIKGLHSVFAISAGLNFFGIIPLILGFRGIKSRKQRAESMESGQAVIAEPE